MATSVITCKDLTKQIGKTSAVDQVNLEIKQGDIYGFLGPNGAGKTTTIRMLLGLIKPTSGSIHIFGKELRKERVSILRKVGSLVEYPSYYGHLNAYDNLETIRRILDVPRSRIDEVLSIVRLTKEAKRPVKGFSLGMKQRLGIAAALLGQPELLILDEPTNGLDPSGILEMRELIKKMPKEHGMTILVSSHLLSEIDQMANRVGIISKGKMIYQDTIEQLRLRSQSHIRLAVNEPETAWRLLRAAGLQVDLNERGLLLEPASNDTIASIVWQLVQNQISVYRVEEHGKSLEDIFLEITGGEGGL
ncbi:putative ABC transporter ATP-binding protein YxlF [compost metagenome]